MHNSDCDSNRTTLPPPASDNQEPADVNQETYVPLRRNRWRVRLEELRNAESQASNNREINETPDIPSPPSVNNPIRNSFVEPSPSVPIPQNFLYEASNSSLINQSQIRQPTFPLIESLDQLSYREREVNIRAQEALIDMRQRQARYYDLAGESSRLYNQNLRLRNQAMALGSIYY